MGCIQASVYPSQCILQHQTGRHTIFGAGSRLDGKLKRKRLLRKACTGLPKAALGSDSPSGDDQPIDIDALARKLSQEADRLRRSESGKDASTSASNGPEPASDDPIFGLKVGNRQP